MKTLKIYLLILIILGISNSNIAQQLTLAQKTACTNDTVRVALNTTAITKLAALTIYISYDTAVLKYVGLESTTSLLSGIISGVPTTGAAAWKLCLSWVDNSLLGVNFGAIKLTDIKFIYKGGSSAVTFLTDGTDLANISGTSLSTTYVNGNVSSTVITTQPSNIAVCTGISTNIPISAATGATFQWQSKSGSVWSNVTNGTSYSGFTTNSLQILQSPFVLNNTNYRCKVVGSCTDYSLPIILTVNANPVVVITHDTSICKGIPTTISGNGSIGFGTLTYSWNNSLGTGISKIVSPNVNTAYQLTVTDAKNCLSTASVNVNMITPAANAGIISGLTTVCQQQNSVVYTVPSISGATSYNWTLPTGATGNSSTNSINVNFSNLATSGTLKIKVLNSCNDSSISTQTITVNALPPAAGLVSGLNVVSQGQNAVVYTVSALANTTSYTWTLPNGTIGSSSTNSITANFTSTASSGFVTVKGNNSCGSGNISLLKIIVRTLKKIRLHAMIQGFYLENNIMNQTLQFDSINQELVNIFNNPPYVDTLSVLIRKTSPPNYDILAEYHGIGLSTNGVLPELTLYNNDSTNKYSYIVIKHRNCIETWSDSVSFLDTIVNYNFYTHSNSTQFPNNMYKLFVNGVQTGNFIFSGDLTQDGTINIFDIAEVFDMLNDPNAPIGYILNDINGDGVVNIFDLEIGRAHV